MGHNNLKYSRLSDTPAKNNNRLLGAARSSHVELLAKIFAVEVRKVMEKPHLLKTLYVMFSAILTHARSINPRARHIVFLKITLCLRSSTTL